MGMMTPLDRVLEQLDGVRPSGDRYEARCPNPAHGKRRGDLNPSLDVTTGNDGRVLVYCHAGCSLEDVLGAIGLDERDLFERNGSGEGGPGTPPDSGSTRQRPEKLPATLENYASYVGIPVGFLKEDAGLTEINYVGEPAVRMPYMDASGEEVLCTRFRVSLNGKPKVKTKSGDKHRLYGLWKLGEAREVGHVLLVEGESDSQTLWHRGKPAAGIPGANGWRAEWAADLEGIDRLYFVVEDGAGEACWGKLVATPEIRERLYRVELDGAKDVSELHKGDPEGFDEKLSAAIEGARAWLDIAETEEQERTRDAWEQCQGLAESTDILAELVADLEHGRLVGEKRNAKLLYLALTSRRLDKIVSVVVKGPSSGGKNHLVKTVMNYFPPSACWYFSGMSERTLFYTEEPLSHRHIVLAEAAGVGGEFQDYIIRTLLSEGFLEYEFVEKTPQGLRSRRLRKEGPTGFLTTTTRDRLFWENETRYLSLTVEDTREQTRRVFQAIAGERAEGPDLGRWLALQTWLEGSEHRVTVPYANELANKVSNAAVRLRRDFSVLLSLVKAHALLHQATRERDTEGWIVASMADYAAVRDLVADLLAEGVEATVPPRVRETVKAVETLLQEEAAEEVTNQEVAAKLDIDKAAASRRVKDAVGRGYLENLEDRRGRPARLVLGEAMPEDAEILPTSEDLEAP
jgi:hypothetical protein